uniref:KIB1-4 beta-propeller domain-containing protein n=1 Tax=Oryza punctata TaxID=4537 RepID=A0A0E0LHW9_ORYPU
MALAGAAGIATVHVVHPLLPHLEFRLPDEFSLFEIHAAADEEEHLVRLPLSKDARLRAGLPLEETDAEMLQRVYKPDKEDYPYITMVTLSCSPACSDDDDCVALCVYRRGLAAASPYRAPGTRVEVGWEHVEPDEYNRKFVSVVHLNGSFYVRWHGAARLHPAGGQQQQRVVVPPRVEKFADRRTGNTGPCGDRGGGSPPTTTPARCPWDDDRYLCAFRWDDELRFWRRARSFGGRALFLSAGTAFFADARILPWCAGDCIYPTDDESVLAGKNVTVRCYDMRSRLSGSCRSMNSTEADAYTSY